jgi:lipoprotein-anchoring transpeptidase ErfK/SrfK
MIVDYYSLMTKAVSGKTAAAREKIYRDAHALIARSDLTRQVTSSHAAALDDAIRRIEDEIAVAPELLDETSPEAISRVLSSDTNWKRIAFSAGAVVAVIALSALLYEFAATSGLGTVVGNGATVSSTQKQRGREDVVMADLKPGVDGGSSSADLPFSLQRQVVFYRTTVVPGSIVVDRENRFLYLIDANNSARRYGIGIAQECLKEGSLFRVANKLEWPDWRPSTVETAKGAGSLLERTGRPGSPLGSRALLLDKPGLIIHGTNSPKTIGHLVASGCIRLVNDDVEDLYRRVSLQSRVVFVS